MQYLKNRFSETSSRVALIAAIGAAAAIPQPYSYMICAIAFLGFLYPEKPKQ